MRPEFSILEDVDTAVILHRDQGAGIRDALLYTSSISKAKLAAAIRDRKREIKLEEERRLCYVAMTRAREHLWLTLATQYNGRERLPSMFLEEIGYDNWRAMDASRLDIPGITYLHDEQIKSMESVRDSELEREKARRRRLITESLDSGSLEESLGHLLAYPALRGGGGSGSSAGDSGGGDPGNEPDYFEIITRNHAELDPCPHVREIIKRNRSAGGMPVPVGITFSVTSINTYLSCSEVPQLPVGLNTLLTIMLIVREQNHFINRESELSSLQEAFCSDRAELIVIYGRRRIGKTELIKKAIRGKKAGYFFVEQALEKDNLESFKKIISQVLDNPLTQEAISHGKSCLN